jgi:hypothetical protein
MPSGAAKPTIARIRTAGVIPYLPSVSKTARVAEPWTEGIYSADNDLSIIQDDLIDLQKSIDSDELLYDDTLGLDRYDMDFKSADKEWVDIPLMDEDK